MNQTLKTRPYLVSNHGAISGRGRRSKVQIRLDFISTKFQAKWVRVRVRFLGIICDEEVSKTLCHNEVTRLLDPNEN